MLMGANSDFGVLRLDFLAIERHRGTKASRLHDSVLEPSQTEHSVTDGRR
jgi:hypothetical protein